MKKTSSHRDAYNTHILHPWADLPNLGEDNSTSIIVEAEGIYIYDEDGNKLIDGPAGMWCMQTGYGRREIADAVAAQIMTLGYNSPWSSVNTVEAELAARIASKTPGDLNRIFFTTGGSTAVDAALRLCQLANNIKGKPQKKYILSRDQGYHGSTYLAGSVTGKERDKSAMDSVEGLVHFISAPTQYGRAEQMEEGEFCDFLIDELEQKILELGPENVMCLIAELVLASGGVIVPPADYNRRCWEIAKKYDVVYIADEVVTGFGRLGHWFASEEVFGVVPDIITFAKGVTSGYVPLGGYAVSDRFMESISGENADGVIYSNGYTWSGNPVSCAAALATWDIFESEDLLAHVRDVGPYFQEQLGTLIDSPLVGEVRGVGLMAAVILKIQALDEDDALTKDYAIGKVVDKHCHDFGLLVRPLINMCVLSPPLIITREQIDDLVSALRKGIAAALVELREEGIWKD
ncbi:MAG: putrescine aminotransferase [Halieaceae bacterium]|jgi:putrescine aminotransferase